MRSILSLVCCILVFFTAALPAGAATEKERSTEAKIQAKIQWGVEVADRALAAIEKGKYNLAEEYWTQLIAEFPDNPVVWSNRGSTLVGENRIEEAISDFNKAIAIDPQQADPYLNRGTAFERIGKYQEAIEDYNRVLAIDPNDAMAYNNRGNAKAGKGSWDEAIADYRKASELRPSLAIARVNEALALYQTGDSEQSLKNFRNLTRKYPLFADVRAGFTALLWESGNQGEAESNWVAAVGIDSRYQDIDWVAHTRRWPPKMVVALEKFLKLN
jgi:tetratricopeptide (TPR) repeat protein